MLERFVAFYEDTLHRSDLHGYILQMLWDIYNHDNRDDLDDVEVDDKDDLLKPNFSDDPEDEWDIVSFFDGSVVWKKFIETVSSEMEARLSGDEHIPKENNEEQLDQLLQKLLEPNKDDTSDSTTDSSTDSDSDSEEED